MPTLCFNAGCQGIVFNRAIQQRATSSFSLFAQQAVWALIRGDP